MHTTASDGRLSPSAVVARAAAVGLSTISVTDHDTVAAFAEVLNETAAAGMTLVSGIEITSVHAERDVHILGYFIDESDADLARFLAEQRSHRLNRAREIAARLARLGRPIDVESLLGAAAANPGSSLGRPAIARAMIDAGHVSSFEEAFDRFLGSGQPAFVPRTGPSPAAVVAAIHAAGGVASLAHPGVTRQPALIAPLADEGLDALEAYHSDHTPAMQQDALETARRLGLLVSGGSDYHGDDSRRPLGGVMLPRPDFDALAARAGR
jgi:3',5'-nucleoside bisphosphate phosphatase